MRIIIIRIIFMSTSECSYKELILNRKEIDFSKNTIFRLKCAVLKNIECIARMLCEPKADFQHAVETGAVKIGGAQTPCGKKLIYLAYQNQNFVVPYIDVH